MYKNVSVSTCVYMHRFIYWKQYYLWIYVIGPLRTTGCVWLSWGSAVWRRSDYFWPPTHVCTHTVESEKLEALVNVNILFEWMFWISISAWALQLWLKWFNYLVSLFTPFFPTITMFAYAHGCSTRNRSEWTKLAEEHFSREDSDTIFVASKISEMTFWQYISDY